MHRAVLIVAAVILHSCTSVRAEIHSETGTRYVSINMDTRWWLDDYICIESYDRNWVLKIGTQAKEGEMELFDFRQVGESDRRSVIAFYLQKGDILTPLIQRSRPVTYNTDSADVAFNGMGRRTNIYVETSTFTIGEGIQFKLNKLDIPYPKRIAAGP